MPIVEALFHGITTGLIAIGAIAVATAIYFYLTTRR